MKRQTLLLLSILLTGHAFAQVPVKLEPRHKNAYEDQQVRILDVRLPPGDTSLYHIHETPSVFFIFTSTITGSQDNGSAPRGSARTVAGTHWYNGFPEKQVHRVWNADSILFHVMDIEILNPQKPKAGLPLSDPSLHLEVDSAKARIYTFLIQPNDLLTIPANRYCVIGVFKGVLGADGKKIQESFYVATGRTKTMLKNDGLSVAEGCIFEVR